MSKPLTVMIYEGPRGSTASRNFSFSTSDETNREGIQRYRSAHYRGIYVKDSDWHKASYAKNYTGLHPVQTTQAFSRVLGNDFSVNFYLVPFARSSGGDETIPYTSKGKWTGKVKRIAGVDWKDHYKYFNTAIHMKAKIEELKPDVVIMSTGYPGAYSTSKEPEKYWFLSDALESVAYKTNTPIVQAVKNKPDIRLFGPKVSGFEPNPQAPYVMVFNKKNTHWTHLNKHHSGIVHSMRLNPNAQFRFTFIGGSLQTAKTGSGNSFTAPAWAALALSVIMRPARSYSHQIGKSLAVKAFLIDHIEKIKSGAPIKNDNDLVRSLNRLENDVYKSYSQLAKTRGVKLEKSAEDSKHLLDAYL